MSLNTQTISSLREQLIAGDISPADILDSLAENISNSDVGAYLGHDLDFAKHEATSVDLTKPLGGIPIGIKDLRQPVQAVGGQHVRHGMFRCVPDQWYCRGGRIHHLLDQGLQHRQHFTDHN